MTESCRLAYKINLGSIVSMLTVALNYKKILSFMLVKLKI